MAKLFLMDIPDKILIDNGKCPPHYIPHKLPFGEPITNESCHFHNARWRMMHHSHYCKKLECPNYDRMIEAYNEHLKNSK